mgnify:CR=1 FL=1
MYVRSYFYWIYFSDFLCLFHNKSKHRLYKPILKVNENLVLSSIFCVRMILKQWDATKYGHTLFTCAHITLGSFALYPFFSLSIYWHNMVSFTWSNLESVTYIIWTCSDSDSTSTINTENQVYNKDSEFESVVSDSMQSIEFDGFVKPSIIKIWVWSVFFFVLWDLYHLWKF